MSKASNLKRDFPTQDWQRDPVSRSLSYYARGKAVTTSQGLVSNLQAAAIQHGSARLCLHAGPDESTQIMLIAQNLEEYSPPKKHPRYGKWIHVVSGKLLVAAFSDQGDIEALSILIPGDSFGIYFPRNVFHTNFPLDGVSVFVESVAGPFTRAGSNSDAPWAPNSRDKLHGRKFREKLIRAALTSDPTQKSIE